MPRLLLPILTLVAVAWTAAAAVQPNLDASEVQERWENRLAGKQFTANVKFAMPQVGERRMTIRWDDTHKRERLLVRLEWPDELRGSTWLMLENNDRMNDYFYYSTARASSGVHRLQKIVQGNPFAGGEFDYLGFRVARHGQPVAKAVETAEVDGRKAFVLTEEAKGMHFDERKIWIDAETFVPLRGEYWRGGQHFLSAKTEDIREVQGVPTPVRIRFEYPLPEKGSAAVWTVEAIDYDRPILESYFARPH